MRVEYRLYTGRRFDAIYAAIYFDACRAAGRLYALRCQHLVIATASFTWRQQHAFAAIIAIMP